MRSSISASEYGRRAETLAAIWLRLRGYRILGRNVRVAGREVDVVARRGRTLVVCEVKARRSRSRGAPVEAVDPRKQRRLVEAGEMLRLAHPGVKRVRFDVIAVDGLRVTHVPAAF
ncbi:MAG TPA: YraN family protein [Gaiellales bacterium]|nr:YraN family protein [Gaiellales bacterium]